MITRDNLKEVLEYLGFERDLHDLYSLKLQGSEGTISVDFQNEKLIYPAAVEKHDDTTSNFSHNENFVVFECVCRLLKIGYRPEHIELEPRWQIGHNPSGGKADILIRNEKGESYIIIECKTPGTEYNREKKNTEADGGQLFSYWQQEASTKWLALYASDYKGGKIVYDSHVIHSEDDANILKLAEKDKAVLTYVGAANNQERYNVWKETYHKEWLGNILFYPDSQAYKVGIPPLRKKDLKDFTPDDKIANRFEEILRHNNVSDKENAFNRLIALFICKLVDEIRKQDEDEVEFQYRQGSDTYETLQDKLQRLHHQGMSDFMREEVIYIPSDYAESLFQQYTGHKRKEAIKELNNTIRKLKFYSNNDFSFKDVHNEDLFLQNGKILVEVVQLFQPYRIVYPSRHQFLGDLFEQLLNKGFKQNEGQFFTPMPITRFIWDALPLASYIQSHSELPKVIDYACGAGHFLTEAVEAINAVRETTDNAWTEKYIFGVEKDYRLARVSKISMFMNGAGLSNIIFGDGLENYPEKGIVKESFDILVANPPYSVKSFKQHLKLKNNQFDLLQSITNDSGEIETLFVERISQLLKPQGIAAVILPASILSNDSSSYTCAREKLLENFYIRAIVALGNKTFGATGTNTVMLFLERYNEPPRMANLIKDSLDDIFNCEDLENFGADKELLCKYTEHQGISIAEYMRFLSKAIEIEAVGRHPYLKAYIEAFNRIGQNYPKNSTQEEKEEIYKNRFYKYSIGIERDKLYFFALAYKQRVLVVNAPSDNDEQKEFLGYTWSNRKGNEGIVITNPGGKLYNSDNRGATETLAYVVRNSFMEETPAINADLRKYIRYYQLKDMMNFANVRCSKEIATVAKEASVVSSKFELVKLADMAQSIEKGKSITQAETIAGEYKVVAGGKSYAYTHNAYNRKPNVITVSASGSAGFVNLWRERIFASDCITIYGKSDRETLYLFYYLKSIQEHIYTLKTGANQPHVYAKDLATIQIPCPPDEVQQKIVEECEAIDDEYNRSRTEIEMYREKINEIFVNLERVAMSREKKLKEICNIRGGKRIPKGRGFSTQPTQHPYIRVTDFSRGTINMKDLRYIDDDVYKCISRYTISSDDIYLSIAGTIGLVGTIPSELNGANLTENAAKLVIKNNEEVIAKFLVYALQTKSAKEQIDSYTHAVGVPKLALERIREIKVYIPTIDKQNSIVYQVNAYEQAIEKAQVVMDGCAARIQGVLDKYLRP